MTRMAGHFLLPDVESAAVEIMFDRPQIAFLSFATLDFQQVVVPSQARLMA